MTEEPRLSEEFLNAFVDNQLDVDEKSRAFPVIQASMDMNRAVCEIRKVNDLVRLAYDTPPAPPRARSRVQRMAARLTPIMGPLAPPLVLVAGLCMGWGLRATWTAHMAPPTATGPAARATIAQASVTRVLFHLDSNDPDQMREVLRESASLLARYRAEGRLAKVEVLADGPGLALLRAHTTPFAARIARLQAQYPNLIFAACQNTIDRLARRKGIHAHLLPQAVIVPSAIAEIVHLQHLGWTYIRV
ncbi:MAG: hypothetical protein M0Z44_07650 [Gammaproteobacteria bacterium]|nr:hypothetical protein [Gammaproteobacteria bacterium]